MGKKRVQTSVLDQYAEEILGWMVANYKVNGKKMKHQDISNKLFEIHHVKISRNSVCIWLKSNDDMGLTANKLGELQKSIGDKRKYISVMNSLERMVYDNQGAWDKAKKIIDGKLDDEKTVDFKDLISWQNSITKQLELLAKLRGDIQTGNKVTFIMGSNDPKERENNKGFLEYLETNYTKKYTNKTIHMVYVEYTDYQKRSKRNIEGTIIDISTEDVE